MSAENGLLIHHSYLQYTMLRSNDAAQEFIFVVSAPVSTNGTLSMNVEMVGNLYLPGVGLPYVRSSPATLLHVKTHCGAYTKSL